MFASGQIRTKEHAVSLKTFEITGDRVGLVSSFFRLVYDAILLTSINLDDVDIQPASTEDDVARIWMRLFRAARTSNDIDISQLVEALHRHRGFPAILTPEDLHAAVKILITSLPESLVAMLFSFETHCSACNATEVKGLMKLLASSDLTLQDALSRAFHMCSTCRSSSGIAMKTPPVLFAAVFPASNRILSIPLQFNIDKMHNALLGAVTLPQSGTPGMNRNAYAIIVDVDNKSSDEIFVVNAVAGSSIRAESTRVQEVTYLKPDKVVRYLRDCHAGAVYSKLGSIQALFYLNINMINADLRSKLLSQFRELQPEVPQLTRSAIVAAPTYTQDVPIQSETPQVLEATPKMPVLPAYVPPAFSRRASYCQCNFSENIFLWVVIIIVGAIALIALIMSAVVIGWINTTLVVNRFVVQNQAAIGVPNIQNAQQFDTVLTNDPLIQVPMMTRAGRRGAEGRQSSDLIRAPPATQTQFTLYTERANMSALDTVNFTNRNISFTTLDVTTLTVNGASNFLGSMTVNCPVTSPTINLSTCMVNTSTLMFNAGLTQGPNAIVSRLDVQVLNATQLNATNALVVNTLNAGKVSTNLCFANFSTVLTQFNATAATSLMGTTSFLKNATMSTFLVIGPTASIDVQGMNTSITMNNMVFVGNSVGGLKTISLDNIMFNFAGKSATFLDVTTTTLAAANGTFANLTTANASVTSNFTDLGPSQFSGNVNMSTSLNFTTNGFRVFNKNMTFQGTNPMLTNTSNVINFVNDYLNVTNFNATSISGNLDMPSVTNLSVTNLSVDTIYLKQFMNGQNGNTSIVTVPAANFVPANLTSNFLNTSKLNTSDINASLVNSTKIVGGTIGANTTLSAANATLNNATIPTLTANSIKISGTITP